MKTAYNMGFSAMLADEYVLIVPFVYHLQSGLTNHRISAQQNPPGCYMQFENGIQLIKNLPYAASSL